MLTDWVAEMFGLLKWNKLIISRELFKITSNCNSPCWPCPVVESICLPFSMIFYNFMNCFLTDSRGKCIKLHKVDLSRPNQCLCRYSIFFCEFAGIFLELHYSAVVAFTWNFRSLTCDQQVRTKTLTWKSTSINLWFQLSFVIIFQWV